MAEHVCVVGLDHVGLPMALTLARASLHVTGVEASEQRARDILASRADSDEPGLAHALRDALDTDRLVVSRELPRAHVYLIATPSSEQARRPHPSLDAIARELPRVMPQGALVLLESTCAPGTTRAALAKPLERAGWRAGQDVFVAHSPERVLPGDALRELIQNDRVVGGATSACTQRALDFYRRFTTGAVRGMPLEQAELTKLVENAYRDVNIALANELAELGARLGVDMLPVLEHANTHPRVHVHAPGVGVGGRCLPLATRLLGQLAQPQGPSLLAAARHINTHTPTHLAGRILSALPPSPQVGLLGVAYKANVADTTDSPSAALLTALEVGGASVRAHDPWVRHWEHAPLGTLAQASQGSHALVLAAGHDDFQDIACEDIARRMSGRMVFDLCDKLDPARWRAAGLRVFKRGQSWP